MKLLNKSKNILLLILVFSFTAVQAQIDFDPVVDDEIPINGLVVVGLIAGAALGLRKIKK